MKTPLFVQLYREDHAAIRHELIHGITSKPQLDGAFTSPKYLYDALGSKLFEAITELSEYYPTRIEASIFELYKADMARHVPQAAQLIDLGAGNCNKAARLFDHFNPSRYVAVDISVDFLRSSIECLQRQYPELDMFGVGVDFSSALDLPVEVLTTDKPRVLFYPGSSIGNFTPDEALVFMKQAHGLCMNQDFAKANQRGNASSKNEANSGILLGVDLVKGVAQLEAAYDDALGVTAAFNRNLLLHINRLVGCNFNLSDWSHVALYNEEQARIEMHLEAQRDVTLAWDGGSRQFVKDERIHTENSYKWTVPGFAKLLQAAGFQVPTVWTDDAMQFAVMWAKA